MSEQVMTLTQKLPHNPEKKEVSGIRKRKNKKTITPKRSTLFKEPSKNSNLKSTVHLSRGRVESDINNRASLDYKDNTSVVYAESNRN